MTSAEAPQTNQQQQQPAAAPAQAVPNTVPPTPPTGLEQQLAGLNQQYAAAQNAPQIGYSERERQLQQSQAEGAELPSPQGASTNLNSIARNLAENYGLPLGRGALVDESGNFLQTPDQIAAASGGALTMGEAAAKMNFIAEALENQQQREGQSRAVSALQTGLGQVQSRGRGSLAAMQSGFYQNLASLYANEEYDLADFSYFIQKEQLDMQSELMRRQEDLAKDQARGGFITGVGLGIAGIASGNPMMAAGGFASAGGQASQTGWF